jgi:2-C-methyl-D-erythritol 4-phosphate cytidylyltransferase
MTGVGGVLLAMAATVCSGATEDAATAESLLWRPLAGRTVLEWSLVALLAEPAVEELVVLVEPGREPEAGALAERLSRRPVAVLALPDPGEAILRGLDSLSTSCRLALIHQASRPLLTPESIARGIETAQSHPGQGAAAYLPVRETIKEVESGVVVATLPRDDLALLSTPQIFPREKLVAAYRAYQGRGLTSPAAPVLVAREADLQLVLYPADPEDLAIGTETDLAVAVSLLGRRLP